MAADSRNRSSETGSDTVGRERSLPLHSTPGIQHHSTPINDRAIRNATRQASAAPSALPACMRSATDLHLSAKMPKALGLKAAHDARTRAQSATILDRPVRAARAPANAATAGAQRTFNMVGGGSFCDGRHEHPQLLAVFY